jgi:hypothetical protein
MRKWRDKTLRTAKTKANKEKPRQYDWNPKDLKSKRTYAVKKGRRVERMWRCKGWGEGNYRDVVKEGLENGKGGVRETVKML